ncbi:YkgJ family cysteine cluster protein [Extibacter sp. GGCC_0201]|uniref:YkgJ family cysteine cluster protein n=1 Tax=Extibacter sp. GGCC_0201 TaxID=2731209 RepID=UPI001AA11089|nr:YkgJ family cysteine cluster protein [Extibacter sp. GGCC_0201]MBO1720705.1 YkgJ family cysteine cluster protein [Extibacter sp. GGCC_0201]
MKQSLIDEYLNSTIKADETFQFHCTQCGKCCLNREDIILTPKDLFRISQKLTMLPEKVIRQYCDAYIGRNSHLPVVRLNPQGQLKRCPLLSGNQCSVHDAKPAVCAIFPIGRFIRMEKGSHSISPKIEFICQNPGCGDNSETHTVQDWLSSFEIEVDDWFFVKWTELLAKLSMAIQKTEGILDEMEMRRLWNHCFKYLYLNYNPYQPFKAQFQSNRNNLLKLAEMFSIV